jgi:hypothetical protein
MEEFVQVPDVPKGAASAPHEPRVLIEDHIESVRVRRAPKYAVFLALGAALGLVVAMILTFVFNGTGDVSPNTGLVYTQTQVFGFLALACITVGVVVGAVVALILDRVLARRARDVTVDRERIHIED